MARVFMVDEDRTTLAVLSAFARRGGHCVESFVHPTDAVRALRDRRPHVLVTDRTGRDMAGGELIRAALRADPAIAVVRVFDPREVGGASPPGEEGPPVLTKPVTPRAFDRALRRAVRRRRAEVHS